MADLRRVANPPNPFESRHVEWEGPPPEVALEVYEERAKSIVTENRSPDVGFRFGVNPYRGCFHGCVYCYARPSHQYWGFGAGSDFDRKIVAKVNAPELLDRELSRDRCRGELLAFSGNTDCYQPLEASYRLTRRCLEVCLKHAQPVSIITKGTLIRRDIELLAELGRRAPLHVWISVAFSDDRARRVLDPFAPPVDARFETMRRLADAGIEVGLACAPVIPGLSDAMVPAVLERAANAGATRAFMSLVRLPREVAEVFEARLEEAIPERADRVKNAIREMRGGRVNDARFGLRMRGSGARWDTIEQLFAMQAKRLGLQRGDPPKPERPKKRQLSLF